MTTIHMEQRGSAAVQGPLWNAAAEEWATLMEPQARALFDAVIGTGLFSDAVRVLDAGCGSGLFAALLATRGCEVVGVDAAEALLTIARRRNPAISFHHADLEALPLPDEHVDVVTGINSFQYAAHVQNALCEARRVTRRGGHVVIATWGLPDACEAAAYIAALKPLIPPRPPHAPGPFALADESVLSGLVASAGLTLESLADVDVVWEFADRDETIKAMLSAGPAVLAIQTSGRDAVIAAIQHAIAPYRLASGAYRLENQFRYAVTTRK